MKGVLRMSRNAVQLPCGGCATESEVLSALAHEANERGISYGQLVANTTEGERSAIIRAYCVEKRKRRHGK